MSHESKYFVKATQPYSRFRSPCKTRELKLYELRLIFHPNASFSKLRFGLEATGHKMLKSNDDYFNELRNGMVLFIHIPEHEKTRIDRLLWDENEKTYKDLYVKWDNDNDFKGFTAKVPSSAISKSTYITLDQIIGEGKIFGQTIDLNNKKLDDNCFYFLRTTLYRKIWPPKWVAMLLFDHINSKWWYWTAGLIPISENN